MAGMTRSVGQHPRWRISQWAGWHSGPRRSTSGTARKCLPTRSRTTPPFIGDVARSGVLAEVLTVAALFVDQAHDEGEPTGWRPGTDGDVPRTQMCELLDLPLVAEVDRQDEAFG